MKSGERRSECEYLEFFFYVLGRCVVVEGSGGAFGWRARGHPTPKRAQNEFVFRKKTMFMAWRVRGGVRARGAAIGARAGVRARPRSASRHTYRAPHTCARATHTTHTRNTTCAPYLCHLIYFNSIK